MVDIPRIIADVQARYRPDVWILTDRWPIKTLVTRQGTVLAPTDPRRNKLIETVLRSLLQRLTADGARVLFVPTPPPGEPVDCALNRLAAEACQSSIYSVRDQASIDSTNTVHRAVAGLPRVTLVSIDNVVCPDGGQCPAMINGTVVRYDSIHFSEAYSRRLVPVILKRAQRSGLTFTPHSH